MLMSVTQYAKHRSCYPGAVQTALKAGRIKFVANGLIDSDVADRDWAENTNEAKARTEKRKVGVASHRSGPAKSTVPVDLDKAGGVSYAEARAEREVYEARLRKLEWEEKLGTLVSKKSVEMAAFNKFRILRDALFNIPIRVAATCAAETDAATIHELLTQEIRLTLEQFAGDGK